MAQWIKHLFHQCESLNSYPRSPHKSWVGMAVFWDLSVQEAEAGMSPWSKLTRDTASVKWKVTSEDTQHRWWASASLYTHIHACTCMSPHMHTHQPHNTYKKKNIQVEYCSKIVRNSQWTHHVATQVKSRPKDTGDLKTACGSFWSPTSPSSYVDILSSATP